MLKIKFLATFVAVLFVSQFAMAQSSGSGNRSKSGQPSRELRGKEVVPTGLPSANEVMTDKQVVKFIKEEQKKGTPNSEIIAQLLLKGVTEAQLIRVRDEYLSAQGNALLVEEDVKEFDGVPTRIRENSQFSGLAYTIDSLDVVIPDSLGLAELKAGLKKKKMIFGHNIFANKSLVFEPNVNMATPENYRLGPGDEVIIDVWGASQSTFRDFISPDGYVNIDMLGLVYLNGKSVKAANEYLKDKYSQIYAGISADTPNAEIKLTLGQARSIQVRVMGEVENPGTYTVSSFASVFHALYLAGGVTEIGTLRAIKVSRNNEVVATLDIYDYLLNGKTGGDITLADGDVITASTYISLVNVEGGVKRPMYYEMKEGETAFDLLSYAGGFARNAYRGDVRIERVGKKEMQIFTLDEQAQRGFLIKDGDIMTVDTIANTYENIIEAKGAFFRPGKFQLGAVKSVKELVEIAGGLKPDAYINRAILNRRLPDMTMENLSVDIKGILDGTVADIELRNNDVLFVQSIQDMQEIQYINIFGEVAFPGKYKYALNTKVEDVILMAGGLTERAATARVEVVRKNYDPYSVTSSDTLSTVYTFEIDNELNVSGDADFVLMPYDAIYIRRSPSYVEQRNVQIEGEVSFAGTYVINNKNMRLSDLVNMAGGVTRGAYVKGARLERKLSLEDRARMEQTLKIVQRQMDSVDIAKIVVPEVQSVGINLEKALANPGGEFDLLLSSGDKLVIPEYENTVTISGNVMFPNTVSYKDGENLKYYINQAGGYGLNAKKSKAIIVYKNGTVARAKNKASYIEPGCEIIVPTKIKSKGMTTAEIFSLASTSASLATVIISLINYISK